jgi:hypothetical protein
MLMALEGILAHKSAHLLVMHPGGALDLCPPFFFGTRTQPHIFAHAQEVFIHAPELRA